MALTGERVQKMSAEAFSRLKNDHEQFLEAYESKLSPFRGAFDSRRPCLGKKNSVCVVRPFSPTPVE